MKAVKGGLKMCETEGPQEEKQGVENAKEITGARITKDNWHHRSNGMRCNRCMWFVRKETLTPSNIGRCRRHAPTMNGYPVVFMSDWCGDHKLDENAY